MEMRFKILKSLFAARRRHAERGEADEPLLDSPEKRQDLMRRIAAGIAASKFPPR
jgi:hypothetical protein